MRRRIGAGLFLRLAPFCLLLGSAAADSVAEPTSYVVRPKDSQFVFVMLAPNELEQFPKVDIDRWEAELKAKPATTIDELKRFAEFRERAGLHRTYSKSGLYRNGDSSHPLWTVDWYAYQVFVSSDGHYLVRMGPWAQSLEDEAVTFFKDGKALRTYSVGKLIVSSLWFQHTVSHFFYVKNAWLEDHQRRFMLFTTAGDQFVFDVTSGEMVHSHRSMVRRILFGGALTIFLLLIAWRARR